jgi:hypothetical protein
LFHLKPFPVSSSVSSESSPFSYQFSVLFTCHMRNGTSSREIFSAFLDVYSPEFINSESEAGGEGGLILGPAYYNNPRHPISLKEVKGGERICQC